MEDRETVVVFTLVPLRPLKFFYIFTEKGLVKDNNNKKYFKETTVSLNSVPLKRWTQTSNTNNV